MGKEKRNGKNKYVIVIHIPFAITEEGCYAVDTLWGWDLEAYCTSGFFNDLLIVGPRDYDYDKEKYPFVFNKGANISFYNLYSWKNTISSVDTGLVSRVRRLVEFIEQLPAITWKLWNEMRSWDVIHSNPIFYPPVGILANILGYFRGKKRVFVFDADIASVMELQIRSESKPKALLLMLLKTIYSITVRFCVRTSQVTIVLGNALFERYRSSGNVFMVHASWVRERDIVSAQELEEKLSELGGSNLRLMLASSLIRQKGVEYAIEAARILVKEMRIGASLDIYGQGAMRSMLGDLVERYGLSGVVRFKGVIPYGDQFYAALRTHDCLLIPNLTGELPRVLFDALANGAAVIASNIEAINAVVSDGQNALLVRPGDASEIAGGVKNLDEDRELLKQLTRTGVDTAKMFTRESRVMEIEEIIRRTLDAKLVTTER